MARTRSPRGSRPVLLGAEFGRRTIALHDDASDYPTFYYSGPEPDPTIWHSPDDDDDADDEEWERWEAIGDFPIDGEPLITRVRRAAA